MQINKPAAAAAAVTGAGVEKLNDDDAVDAEDKLNPPIVAGEGVVPVGLVDKLKVVGLLVATGATD